jgi:hypothetical protein
MELAGRRVPPLVTQIADGENGGVMMHEFPPKYLEVVRDCSGSRTPMLNVTEYLDSGSTVCRLADGSPALSSQVEDLGGPRTDGTL